MSTWTLWLESVGTETNSLACFTEHFRHQIFRNAQFPLITYWIQMRSRRPSTMALSKLFKIESRCRLTSAKSDSAAKAVTALLAGESPSIKASVIWVHKLR